MIKKLSLFVLAITILTGCGAKKQLVKDVTQKQLGKDNGECRLEAQKATQFDLSGNVFIQQNRQSQAFENCLQSKGYAYQQELNEQQKSIDARYGQALVKWKEKMEPISEYIINVCRPKENKEYISCLNGKNDDIIAVSLFPDIDIKMFNARKEFEQQLIRGEIARKEFKENANNLSNDFTNKAKERAANDIKTGIYTGKY